MPRIKAKSQSIFGSVLDDRRIAQAQADFEALFQKVVPFDSPDDRPWNVAPNGRQYEEHVRVGGTMDEVLNGFLSAPRGGTLYWRIPLEVAMLNGNGKLRAYARFAVE